MKRRGAAALPAIALMAAAAAAPGTAVAAAQLRFGIDRELAGSAGSGQNPAKPVSGERTLRALRVLRPNSKQLVLRVNRLFESDGDAGIRRLERIIDRYTREGFDTELQVRYHPPTAQTGDIATWTRDIRHVVDVFGPNRHPRLPVRPGRRRADVRGPAPGRRGPPRAWSPQPSSGERWCRSSTPSAATRPPSASPTTAGSPPRQPLDHVRVRRDDRSADRRLPPHAGVRGLSLADRPLRRQPLTISSTRSTSCSSL